MVEVAERIAEEGSDPKEFFDRWVDISPKEEKDVSELWFHMSYYESDRVELPESGEWYRRSILSWASRVRDRLGLRSDKNKEANQPPEPTSTAAPRRRSRLS